MNLAPKPSGCLRWYCVATNYGQQFLAEHSLSQDGWRTFFPLHLDRKLGRPDKIGPMFPGYGFVAFESGQNYARIYATRGVYTLLSKVGAYGPQPLPAGIIEGLIERMSARRIVDDPGQDRGVVYLQPGSRGRVTEGALAGWEGLCTMSSRERVRLLLGLLGGEREVEFKARAVVGA